MQYLVLYSKNNPVLKWLKKSDEVSRKCISCGSYVDVGFTTEDANKAELKELWENWKRKHET